jgi:hypothetical protein
VSCADGSFACPCSQKAKVLRWVCRPPIALLKWFVGGSGNTPTEGSREWKTPKKVKLEIRGGGRGARPMISYDSKFSEPARASFENLES